MHYKVICWKYSISFFVNGRYGRVTLNVIKQPLKNGQAHSFEKEKKSSSPSARHRYEKGLMRDIAWSTDGSRCV